MKHEADPARPAPPPRAPPILRRAKKSGGLDFSKPPQIE